MSTSTQQIESQTLQQINRLVSASSPSDALESIYTLTSTLKQCHHELSNSSSPSNNPSNDSATSSSSSSSQNNFETVLSIVTESKDFLKIICILLSESKLVIPSNKKRMMDVEEGDVAILSFLNTVLDYYKKPQKSDNKSFKHLTRLIGKFEEEDYHQSLSIIHSLLDVISIQSLYKQSTTLSILSTLLQIIPTPTVTNILQTPHGLNRIIDLFKNTSHTDHEHNDEKIILRNESIILAISLVKLNPGISKFMIFEDVYDSLMTIASFEYQTYIASKQSNIKHGGKNLGGTSTSMNSESKIINGNLIIVKDCLELCIEMTKQESKMASETFLSNPMTCQVLTTLLDLRNGVYYRNYDCCLDDYFLILEEEKESRRNGGSSSGGGGSRSHYMDGGGRNGTNDKPFERELSMSGSEDGLDDILFDTTPSRNGRIGASPRSGGRGQYANGRRNGSIDFKEEKKYPIPYTTEEEAEIISYSLTLLQTLIQGGDEGFEDESSKMENLMTLKKSTSRDSTSSANARVSTRIQSIVSSKNTKRLSMLLFDMALYTLPPPNSPIEYYVSSVPSMEIQCQALSVMADLGKIAKKIAKDEGNDDLLEHILSCPSMYLREVGCLERVMYLICTGGISFVLDEDNNDSRKNGMNKADSLSGKAVEAVNAAKKVSMHSLGLLRNILTPNEAKLMVMEAFSPPIHEMNYEDGPDQPPMPPQIQISVVQKLVNTMGENLHLLNDPTFSKDVKAIDKERMHINIIGAAGALGIFLTNGAGDTSREVLLRLPLPPPPPILKRINGAQDEDTNEPTSTLVECIMTYLELGTRSTGSSGGFTSSTPSPETSIDVTFTLLRLLTEWIPETPKVISAVLSSPNSVSLGFLLQQKSSKSLSVESVQVIQAMTGVLLGLCMESMNAEDDVGGWSTSSIMNLINVGIGIGKFTQLLEGLKRIIAEGDMGSLQSSVGPWMCCDMERAAILQWYSSSVNVVRRKVVQELSASNMEENDESDSEVTDSDKKTVKSLTKLVAHQNSEIETLRQKLTESEHTMASQALEMNLLKRRIGSNPNKVDDLLDEYSAKILLLEIQAKNLKEDVAKNNSKHQSSLKQQNDELSQLKQDLEISRSETQKVTTAKDAIQEELKQLKFAYSNLETEFHRVTSESSVQTNGDKTAESNNVQDSNNQALQSENLKLKNDIRNANDWMNKAMKKMNDLTKRNTALEAEAAKMSNGNAQSDTETEYLSREVDELKHNIQTITTERDSLQANIMNYENEISSLQSSREDLQKLQFHAANLQSQVDQVQLELENQKKSSSDTISNLQQEIQRKDEEILTMQTSIQNGNSNESKIQQEHTKLSAAYKAAQDWMGQAVKTNDKLTAQVKELKQQNTNLQSNLDSTRSQSLTNTASMEQQILSLTTQRDEVLAKEKSLEMKVKDFEVEKSQLSNEKKALQNDLNTAMNEKASMEEEFKARAKTYEEQVTRISLEKDEALETEKNLRKNFEAAGEKIEALSQEINDLKAKNEEIQDNGSEELVEELRQESINLKKELDVEQLKHASELSALEKTREEMEEKNEKLQIELDAMSKRSSAEFEEKKSECTNLQSELETVQKENEELKVEKEANTTTINDMHTRLTEFQTWTDTAQAKLKEVDSERETLQNELDRLKSVEEAMKVEKSDSEGKMKELADEIEFLKKKEEEEKSQEKELRSEILSLHVEIGHLDGKNRALEEDNKVLEKKNKDLTSKADLLDEVEESLFEKENEVALLQNELTTEKAKLEQLQQNLNETADKEKGKIQELESIVREKETQLVHQEAEAREAITKWEERCDSISAEIRTCKEERDEVEKSFLKLESEIAKYHASIEDLNKTVDAERIEKSTLVAQNEESENAYKNHITELENAIQQHVEAVQDYESQLDERDEALVRAGADIEALNKEIVDNATESEEVVAKWQENSKQLEETIAGLEAIIDNQDNDANAVIAQWEARCNSLSEQIVQLEEQINNQDFEIKIQELETSLATSNADLVQAQDERSRLSESLEEANSALARLKNELQAVKGSLTVEREHREDNISEVQTLSTEKANILEQLKKEKILLKQALQDIETEKMRYEDLSTKLEKTERSLQNVTQISKKNEEDKLAMEADLEREKEGMISQMQLLEQEKRFLEESNEIEKGEVNEMRLIIGQLENELKEANDMLQSHLTDEVTARATEMATNALRVQLKESREKQSFEHEALIIEKEARQVAEKEVQKLKADLSLLLEAENISDSSDIRMKQFTSKAAGEVLESQRGEIDALSKSLGQLMQELQSCQSKEREAEERAANSRLHASACEQELLGAKSDVSLLKDSIERLKIDEAEMRTKLENRLKNLEKERENIVVSLGSEIKNLKAEISQDQIERDRLIHALNESEKANSALVYSTSVENEEGDSSLELELAKLRLEKAQLLAAVQENGSKFEQRVRSACNDEGGKKSSEKELIEAAEKSLNNLQKKYDETVAQLEIANASNADLLHRMKETNMTALKNDLYRAETEVQKLQKTTQELELKLVNTENESKSMSAKMEEKCRLAEAKIIDLERQERKEVALAAEVARLRDEAENSNAAGTNSESKESSLAADEMHDVVLELKQTVREERQVYQDLLSEHEDLLGLLAQQDLEKTSLQVALVKSVGEEAVESAFLEAERQSMQQFGKYIKLK